MIFALTILVVWALGGLALYRNSWVCKWRIWCIYNDHALYERLLDYGACLRRFWVWDIRKLTRAGR